MKKYLYIVNPISGKGSGKKAIPPIKEYCSSNNIDYQISETQYSLHATELARTHSKNFDIIIAVGGDGTVNEVINGIQYGANKIFAVIPVGSGNDFIKNLGLNGNILDTLSVIHDEDKHEKIDVDVGNINFTKIGSETKYHHKFINCLGLGFDAYVGHLKITKFYADYHLIFMLY